MVDGKSFVLAHCYKVLKDEEKWKNRDGLEVSKKGKQTMDATLIEEEHHDDASRDVKRSPTLNSVAKTKTPIGAIQDKDKGNKTGDDDIKKAME